MTTGHGVGSTRRGIRAARRRIRAARRIHLLPLLGIIPSFLLASYALTQPWAQGRLFLVLGISRSPGATLLVLITLVGMISATVTVALRAPRLRTAAILHIVAGLVMSGISWQSFRMVRDAGLKILGVVPIGSIHPGRGLRLFLAASLLVTALGLVELAVSFVRRRRRRHAPPDGAPVRGPGPA